MIIDGHAHALAEFADPVKLNHIMNELGVDKIVLCPGGGADPHYEPQRPKVRQSFLVTNHRILFLSNKLYYILYDFFHLHRHRLSLPIFYLF